MLITSPAFKNGEGIPKKFTCEGGDFNPEFTVQNIPQGTKSLAFLMDDPDAPGGTFTHWIVWDIDPVAGFIKEESKPTRSVEGTNSAAKIGYTGPCPPPGKPHRYFFRVYALDTDIDLIPGVARQEFDGALAGHVLAEAELMGTYQRQ
ncbi:MAG: YbhB/YbcL family Raf kinase inhibitor-like protein [Candidatus Liptonbacteria bacterium]|nr:YbhB/YbcL family Raf kinase inhibitor-like protein [Candidatus Liptonbacteria bacterium]